MSTRESPGQAFASIWDNHVSRMWFQRSDVPWKDPRGAFDEAIEVHYPSAELDSKAFYHAEADVIFCVIDGDARTCIDLSDRSEREQHYVHSQVSQDE